jgi:hypothetical protein
MPVGPWGRRNEALARALVDGADTGGEELDEGAFLQGLSTRCVELFGLASAGFMLKDEGNAMQAVASSDPRGHTLELMELQTSAGPCLDAVLQGAVVQARGSEAARRWPAFATRAQELGYQAYTAIPLQRRGDPIGALNLFSDGGGLLRKHDLRDAQALADSTTIGLLHARALREARLVAEQLQHALTSRIVLEQAKGVLAARLGCDVAEAFEVLRAHARNGNLRLTEVAREVVEDGLVLPAVSRRTPRPRPGTARSSGTS